MKLSTILVFILMVILLLACTSQEIDSFLNGVLLPAAAASQGLESKSEQPDQCRLDLVNWTPAMDQAASAALASAYILSISFNNSITEKVAVKVCYSIKLYNSSNRSMQFDGGSQCSELRNYSSGEQYQQQINLPTFTQFMKSKDQINIYEINVWLMDSCGNSINPVQLNGNLF